MNLAQLDEHDPNLEKELAKVSAAMAVALAEATVNKTFMKGLSDVMNLFSDPNRYSDSYMQNFISSFVPYSSALRSITKALDPIVKDSNELLDKIRKQTPMMGRITSYNVCYTKLLRDYVRNYSKTCYSVTTHASRYEPGQ